MTNRLIHLDVTLAEMRTHLNRQQGERAAAQRRLEQARISLAKLEIDLETAQLVLKLLSLASEAAREQARAHIAQTVTAALQTVFSESMSFEVGYSEQGGQPSAQFGIVSRYAEGTEVSTSVEDARGGGVVDVVSLALRLAVLELHRPKLGGPLILDEPGKHVSAEHVVNLARFLKGYAERTGRQVVLITHQAHLAECADHSFRVVLRNGKSEVTAS